MMNRTNTFMLRRRDKRKQEESLYTHMLYDKYKVDIRGAYAYGTQLLRNKLVMFSRQRQLWRAKDFTKNFGHLSMQDFYDD